MGRTLVQDRPSSQGSQICSWNTFSRIVGNTVQTETRSVPAVSKHAALRSGNPTPIFANRRSSSQRKCQNAKLATSGEPQNPTPEQSPKELPPSRGGQRQRPLPGSALPVHWPCARPRRRRLLASTPSGARGLLTTTPRIEQKGGHGRSGQDP